MSHLLTEHDLEQEENPDNGQPMADTLPPVDYALPTADPLDPAASATESAVDKAISTFGIKIVGGLTP